MVTAPRPARDEWFAAMATLVSRRSTCHRLAVGCVLVNSRGHVLSTGYNGTASGMPNCVETLEARCPGSDAPSGQPNGCQSIHAEQNALLQCRDVFTISTCYVTHSPCEACVKLLMNTSCQRIVFINEYPHPRSRELWLARAKVSVYTAPDPWVQVKMSSTTMVT